MRKVRGTAAVREWFALTESALLTHRGRLNRINVFPVPDSDTGSNMLATVQTSRAAVEEHQTEDIGELLAHAGSAAMNQAGGNSGILLAVFISGFAEPLSGSPRLTLSGLSHGMSRASLRAWSALSSPMDGTMLSVLDAARDAVAEAAESAADPQARSALEEAMPAMVARSREAVIRTEQQLAPLSEARVVDSGGLGLLIVLEALAATICAREFDDDLLTGVAGWNPETNQPTVETANHSHVHDGGVELMCTVQLDPLGAASLRHQLDELGDSVIITPIDGASAGDDHSEAVLRWRIHVHTGDVDATLAAVQEAGELEDSTVTQL